MRRAATGAAWLVAAVLGAAGAAPAQTDPDELVHLEKVLKAAIARASPWTVTVETFGGARRTVAAGGGPVDGPGRVPGERRKGKGGRTPRPRLRPPGFLQSQGATTGVVLSADGWIVVSRFALALEPSTILVTLADGRVFEARRGGEDTSRGLALVKIEAEGLPTPEFVPPERVRVGQWAFAIGRTFGRRTPSVHMGIVSATGRLFGRAIQTDAYTSPANYGGPLIDVRGRVLGVCVPLSRGGREAGAELYDSGIGFAATLFGLGATIERMKRGEVLHRGYLGVSTDPAYLGPGARIVGVMPDAPAARAGLRRFDVIVEVDGRTVRNGFHLQDLISSRMGGDQVELRGVRRSGEAYTARVRLADLPAAARRPAKPAEEAWELPWERGGGRGK